MLYVARWLYDCRERIPRIYPWGECQLIELQCNLEGYFGVIISDDDFAEAKTVGDVLSLVETCQDTASRRSVDISTCMSEVSQERLRCAAIAYRFMEIKDDRAGMILRHILFPENEYDAGALGNHSLDELRKMYEDGD